MKKTLIIGLALVLGMAAAANPVSPKRAAKVAQHFWQSLPDTPKGDADLSPTPWQYDAIYLFSNADGGYVLVAADNEARPILGYSTTATLDPDDMPIALQQWLQGYQTQIDRQRAQKEESHVFAEAWNALEWGLTPKDSANTGVAPLLTTQWDQTHPYSAYCPAGTVTGCAATAQAQIMNFWRHPAFGNGSHTYTHYTYGRLSADFAHTRYDWAAMPARATVTSTEREKEAVATLMYHCGVSLDMNYGTAADGGSAALGLYEGDDYATINNALKNYFYYDPHMHVINKDNEFTNDEWRDSLMAELDLGHPIVYTGQGPAGGHGFICDGYDSRGYMHFNFGWSGRGDGYFPVDSICPGTGGVGGGSYQFNEQNSALIGLVPLYELRVSDTLSSIARRGGTDSVLYCDNPNINTITTVTTDAEWLTVFYSDTMSGPVLRYEAQENNSGTERTAHITLQQGSRQCTIRVVQGAWDEEELCPLTVVMESTREGGWKGGTYLSLESENGYLFGTATLTTGTLDSVQIRVAPHNVNSVWHSGGGSDRYVNYYVRNQHGETLVSAPYAYRTGGTHLIEWPCAHLSIEGSNKPAVTIFPSPATTTLHVEAEGLQRADLMDMSGRLVLSTTMATLDLRTLAAGAYFVRIITPTTTTVRRIVKK